jgi:hypothetical protein
MIEDSNFPCVISVAKSGMNRFFDEGMYKWPEEKLLPLFSNIYLDHPIIKKTLEEWQNEGFITLDEESDSYLTVLQHII